MKALMARTINLFFFQGCMKALGVILEDTVKFVHAGVPLVAWSFTMMEGLSFLCGCGFGLLFLPTMVALAKSFGSSFGTALSICALVSNIGMAVLPPLLEHWREKYGLPGSVALLGALMWHQVICGFLLPVRQKTTEVSANNPVLEDGTGPEQDDTEMPSHDLSSSPSTPSKPRQTNFILAHPSLLFLYITQFFHMIILMAWAMFLVPYGVSKGYPPSVAVLLSTIGGAGVFIGRALAIFVFHWGLSGSLYVILSPMLVLPFLFGVCVYTGNFLLIGLMSIAIGTCLGLLATWMFAFVRDSVCLIHDIQGSYNDVFAFLACVSVAQAVSTVPAIIFANPNCESTHEMQGS
ncbi:Monocarboxylate transporter 12 [Holothuria leucospilota]|uniref:Monocarboxylate transporter 12 n=1 Tax=Holothuria leucospilota TaxID=206669 RepID=A0A9Q1CML8_HOLLE|nr:Monocarboxylate transporter 12 [Holothuria leucospilota]